MNRRSFLGTLVKAFTILPTATTYVRNWVPVGNLVVPEPLDLIKLQEQFFALARTRRSTQIDVFTDSETAKEILANFQKYYLAPDKFEKDEVVEYGNHKWTIPGIPCRVAPKTEIGIYEAMKG